MMKGFRTANVLAKDHKADIVFGVRGRCNLEQTSMLRTRRMAGRQGTTHVQASTPDIFDEEYDDIWPSRPASSVRRYHSDVAEEIGHAHVDDMAWPHGEQRTMRASRKNAIPVRRVVTSAPDTTARHIAVVTEDMSEEQRDDTEHDHHVRPPRMHWLTYIGIAIVMMTVGWAVLSSAYHWWQVTQDDLLYGRPRTYQVNQVVGHNDSESNPSHFIAINLNRHVEVIEMPGGDGTKAKMYMGPVLTGPGQDLAPVTLSFKDVNGDGKVDMIMNVQGSHFVFINDGGQFRPARPGERIQW
jgi:hypothetical protein